MSSLVPVQLIVRDSRLGSAVSVLIARGGETVELNLSPAEALRIALALTKKARIAHFGEFEDISTSELEGPAAGARALDLAVYALDSTLEGMEMDSASDPLTHQPAFA